jgi:hypothetical protein
MEPAQINTQTPSRNQTTRSAQRIDQLKGQATPKAIIIALGLYLASITALSFSDASLEQAAPGVPKPDLVFGYNYERVLEIFTAYGAEGRQIYATNLLIDSVMPVFFAAVTILVIARAFPRWLRKLSIFPLTFMILDLIENASFGLMLSQYPDVASGLVAATSPITMIKLAAFVVAMPTMVIGLIKLIVTGLLQRRAQPV